MTRAAERSSATLGAVVALASIAVSALVATRQVTFGSAAGRWVYPYVTPYGVVASGACLAAALAASALFLAAARVVGSRPAAAVTLALGGGTAIQLLLWRLYPWTAGAIVRSDNATSYFSAAARWDPLQLLRAYGSIAPRLPLHAQGNMPGKLLLFRAMHAFTGSPDAMAVVILVLSNLVGVLVFLIALELLADRTAALGAFALYLFVPSRLVFAPILNGVGPFPVVLALLLWIRFLRGRGPWLAIATGASLFAALLLDPTPLGLGLVFVAAAVADRAEGRVGWSRVAWGVAAVAGTVVACAVAFRGAFGFDTFAELARVAVEAERFNEWTRRTQAAWFLPNLAGFFLALGVAIVAIVAWGLARRPPLRRPATWMALAGLASVLAVDLLGRNRGEVERLWIFLVSPFAIAAAGFLGAERRVVLAVAVAGLVLQGGTMLAVLGFVIP